ncbi:uncharacterized protein LOC127247926 isoform X3 [Andrographis paniculata]|uniref:uncharacterized protein LOC127247926 isoform X3 n=1 Tax=Andrographis paniculata TaxID=175694 RepID=UPI0021E89DBF|nr:uncharacterized protein LOC127247926 isoform X3 [Andrographis paniculata]
MEEGSSQQAQLLKIDLTRDTAVADLTGKVHILPCCIKYNGHTSVSHYFKPKYSGMEADGMRIEEAFFRGRRLHGTTVALPQGYSGFILGKGSSQEEANASNFDCWKTNATFQNVTVWNHDAMPSKDDTVLRGFHWFSVANALHQPVTEEDLESTCINEEPYYKHA